MGYPALTAEESKPFSDPSNPNLGWEEPTWAAATAAPGQRKAEEEARALRERGPAQWGMPIAQPPHSRFFDARSASPFGGPSLEPWQTEKQGDIPAAQMRAPGEYKVQPGTPGKGGVRPTGEKWHLKTRVDAVTGAI